MTIEEEKRFTIFPLKRKEIKDGSTYSVPKLHDDGTLYEVMNITVLSPDEIEVEHVYSREDASFMEMLGGKPLGDEVRILRKDEINDFTYGTNLSGRQLGINRRLRWREGK